MSPTVPHAITRSREIVEPALRDAVQRIPDARMRLIAGYQLGWCDETGRPSSGHGGKSVRAALALVSARAAGGTEHDGVPGAVAVELVHNFSLLHDDVMDGDRTRRHRPTGWAAFGVPHAILAGTAMQTEATAVLVREAPAALPCLLAATQRLISGQSDDVLLESASDVGLDEVLKMEAGKTAALLKCATSIGACSIAAPAVVVEALAAYGHHLGMAFQLVDDVLGITGDPAATGKSASSDLRAGKSSAPIVAALAAGNPASSRLAELLEPGPPQLDEDVALAAKLVVEAGGIDWAEREADRHLAAALQVLDTAGLTGAAVADLAAIGHFVVGRDR